VLLEELHQPGTDCAKASDAKLQRLAHTNQD
jgi:hypothetical protein